MSRRSEEACRDLLLSLTGCLILASLPQLALWLILAGGLLYSFGVIFHAWQRLRFQNVIWHSFVLLGAACHYTAVLDLVLA